MDIDAKISEVSSGIWGGLPYHDSKRELLANYKLIKWFFEHLKDDYLNRAESVVLKALKKDNPPADFIEVLLKHEKEHKNRKKLVKAMEELLPNDGQ